MTPNPEYWTPSKEWNGQDAFLIGGGPSLANFDFSLLKGRNVIGCNDAFRLGPEIIKYNLFGDGGWWYRFSHETTKSGVMFVTNTGSLFNTLYPNMKRMRRLRDGIHKGDTLGWNFSTGAAAINLALSLGAVRVFLLGYDLSNNAGKSHWHPHNPKIIEDFTVKRFLVGFETILRELDPGIEVFNVTDGGSKLPHYPRIGFGMFHSILAEQPFVEEVA